MKDGDCLAVLESRHSGCQMRASIGPSPLKGARIIMAAAHELRARRNSVETAVTALTLETC